MADKNNSPSIYIVKYKPEGFIIISASRKESPILAYSEKSTFNENYEETGFSDWISVRKSRIENLKNNANYDSTPKSGF